MRTDRVLAPSRIGTTPKPASAGLDNYALPGHNCFGLNWWLAERLAAKVKCHYRIPLVRLVRVPGAPLCRWASGERLYPPTVVML